MLNILGILIVIFLLFLSFFFSLAETSLTSASRARIHFLAKKGFKAAETIKNLQNNLSKVVGTLLIGTSLVNVLVTSLSTGILIEIFGEVGMAYAAALTSFLIIIYAEILPKIYALHNAESSALFLAKPILYIVKAVMPLTQLLHFIAEIHLKIFSFGSSKSSEEEKNQQELRGAIEMHSFTGSEMQEEKAMLNSILDLGSVTVEEIMTHRKNVVMLDCNLHPDEFIKQIINLPYTRIPIWENNTDNIIGIIHVKALLRSVSDKKDFNELNIKSLANKPWFIVENTTLYDQLQSFRKNREHFAIVVDEYGTVMGIVTLEDILEEIVGDIIDEYDSTSLGIRSQNDGSFLVEGTVSIRDLNRKFDWNLPDDEASTVAGLLLYETRQLPEIGQIFMLYDFRFEIIKRQKNQISLIRLTPPKKVPEED